MQGYRAFAHQRTKPEKHQLAAWWQWIGSKNERNLDIKWEHHLFFLSCPQEELESEETAKPRSFSTNIKLSEGLVLLCHQCSFPLRFPSGSFSFSHIFFSTSCSIFCSIFSSLTNILQKFLSCSSQGCGLDFSPHLNTEKLRESRRTR